MSKVEAFIKEHINDKNDNPFMVFNVEDVIQRHHKWLELMPRVVPHYAIKANPFPLLLDILVGLGLKFDCASQHELQDILKRGGNPKDIIVANPSISSTCIKYAKSNGIDLLVVDSVNQLARVKSIFPSARIVIRIQVDERYSDHGFDMKFGADEETVEEILKTAKDMKINVMGISFHVGTACQSSRAYIEAIQRARVVFDMAKGMGFSMSLLDIGGGYPCSSVLYFRKVVKHISTFEEIARDINQSLDEFFPDPNLTIIAEPGRHFCETAFTLMTKVIYKKVIKSKGGQTFMYYLNDGNFQSFIDANLVNRNVKPLPFLSKSVLGSRKLQFSTIWGPTLNSADVIKMEVEFPELNMGEWIRYADMGAYSVAYAKFGFNGFPFPTYKILLSEWAKTILMKTDKWPVIKQVYGLYELDAETNADEHQEEQI